MLWENEAVVLTLAILDLSMGERAHNENYELHDL
jgi:hypothetical protein